MAARVEREPKEGSSLRAQSSVLRSCPRMSVLAANRRRLIVNADDFGRSTAINQAVLRAHREGILTTASLMVNGTAFEEAVEIARQNPQLGVGLHLTLICGYSTLGAREIPGLVDDRRAFRDDPVRTGFRYFARRELRAPLRREIAAQFEKFQRTGLLLDHVNGHLNMHLHPVVFGLLTTHQPEWRWTHFRLVRDPFWLNARLASGRWLYRSLHALIYSVLSARAQPVLRRLGARHTDEVFGLLQTGHVDLDYVLRLLPRLPPGDSELYSHPCLEQSQPEFDALVSPSVREQVDKLAIQLIRYQDL